MQVDYGNFFLKVKQIDENFSKDYLSYQFLRFLPSCFDGAVQNVLRRDQASFKYDKIVEELVAEEARIKLHESDSGKHMNLCAQTEMTVSSRSTTKAAFRKFKGKQCWKC